jgi:hypothetical protein
VREFVGGDQRTPEYEAAIAALRKIEAAGIDATRAYAEAVCEREESALERGYGLKRSKGHVCFARLVGKRCTRFDCLYPNRRQKEDSPPCRIPGGDHDTLWLYKGKPVLYLAQPYEVSLETMGELVGLAKQWNLDISVDTYPAFHFPGGVLAVEVWRRDFDRVAARREMLEKEKTP